MHPEHTILVAFTVYAPDWTAAQATLMRQLPKPGSNDIDSWWIAEDERDDGSDNDSAVFVPKGKQDAAEAALRPLRKAASLGGPWHCEHCGAVHFEETAVLCQDCEHLDPVCEEDE